ncbi:MAG TPA: TIGR00266 family protein [Gaiellaceae bacterium]
MSRTTSDPRARESPDQASDPAGAEDRRAHATTLPAGVATVYDRIMKATVREGQAPAVVVALEPGEKLTSEAGAMMFISGDMQMDVEMPGGLMSGLKRVALPGESLFLVNYTARGSGAVGICGPFPGSIREHELDGEIICEKHAYLGHVGEVAIESAFAQRLGMGITGGGESFFLQRLKGKGTVWLHGGGDFLDFDLTDGQRLVVDTGCMVMIEPSVKYEVRMQGGIKKSLFGGEGLFLVHMTGPGHVTLQTLPFTRTARRIREAAHGGGDERGGLISNILGE